MKKFKIILTLFIVSLFLTACSYTKNKDIVYSNLGNQQSQEEVIEILKKHGVKNEQLKIFKSWINDYNSRIKSGELKNKFVKLESTIPNYENLDLVLKHDKNNEMLTEANCRLTSYLLMKNMINTNKKNLKHDSFLMFDIEAIEKEPQFSMTKTQEENYKTLFNLVPVSGDIESHKKAIKKAWKDRNIRIRGKDISLVSVYIHSEQDNIRFIGHVGVLINTKDGLLFVEKFGSLYPFQATKFSSREELKKYLLSRPDLYGEKTELEPLIMEDSKFL